MRKKIPNHKKTPQQAFLHGLLLGLVCGAIMVGILGFVIGYEYGTKTHVFMLSEGIKV
jgi:hypothetical protein